MLSSIYIWLNKFQKDVNRDLSPPAHPLSGILPSLSMGNALHGEDVRAQLQVFIQTKARTWNLGGAAGTATSGGTWPLVASSTAVGVSPLHFL